MRFEESTFFVDQQLVQVCFDILNAIIEAKLGIDHFEYAVQTLLPSRIGDLELRSIKLPTTSNRGISQSLLAFAEWTQVAFRDNDLCFSGRKWQANRAKTIDLEPWIGILLKRVSVGK